ncbi:MAG TPA: hypothetical protein VIW03_08470 [Anaeromyxobacter sp.]
MNDTNGTGPKRLAVLAINERPDRDDEKKTHTRWVRIGVAFTNRDGSINLILDALPLGTNRLQVREDDRTPAPGPRRNGGFDTVEVRP